MAYAALASVSQTLSQLVDFEFEIHPCTRGECESFQETVAFLIDFLDDCPPICTKMVNNLITQIRDSAYEAGDILESMIVTKSVEEAGQYKKSRKFSERLKQLMKDIKLIEKKVKEIHQDGNGVREQKISSLASSSRPALRGDEHKMVALDDDLEMKLMEQLVGGRSKLDVIPIVGMGGIGKTTLARILCNSQLIKESFEIRGWVTISQSYIAHEIVLGILRDIGVPSDRKKDGEQHLYQSLCGRKYLIVLDDVWDTQSWDDIKRLLPDNNNHSRIILTTRQTQVAEYVTSFGSYHRMQCLTIDSSWSLLCREIFMQRDCPSELVEIGMEIAKQCHGLPLAISAIGGHLKKEMPTKEYWKYVSENVSSVLTTTNDPTLEILTLSYNYLPHHLKACFLHFGSFQEDDVINVSDIVKLWVAEGFIKPSISNSMEEVAEEYLREVIERNLVLVYKYDSFGKPKRCGIHDLFRDICIREAKKEKLRCILNKDVSFDSLIMNIQQNLILSRKIIEDDESCPTNCFFIRDDNHTSSSTILPKVLNIRMKLRKFPVEILELVNLKYLHLSHVPEIPYSISMLKNLQTLIVSNMDAKFLPFEIWVMRRLRHLLISGFYLPSTMDDLFYYSPPTNTYVLNSLQTLSKIIDFNCTLEVLQGIPNVRKLNLEYKESFHSLKGLGYLTNLESLRCDFQFWPDFDPIENFDFPVSLKKLVLIGSQIPWEQMTIIGILPNLEVLKLGVGAMKGKLWKTNDGEFKQLKFLLIRYSDLVEWETEKDHFPRLRHLILQLCSDLQAIPWEIGDIPTLERIELEKCSREVASSAQEMLGEDNDIELIISDYESHDLNDATTSSNNLDTVVEDLCDAVASSNDSVTVAEPGFVIYPGYKFF